MSVEGNEGLRSIFRVEAIRSQTKGLQGSTVEALPLSVPLVAAWLLTIIVSLVVFLAVVDYARRVTIPGALVPDGGVARVYSLASGTLGARFAAEGETVKRGQRLFMVDSDRDSSTVNGAGTQAQISARISSRLESMNGDLQQTKELFDSQAQQLKLKMASLTGEGQRLEQQTAAQRGRVEAAAAVVGRTKKLVEEGFVSNEQLEQRKADLLQQESVLHGLQRDQIALSRELETSRSDLQLLPVREKAATSAVQRTIEGLKQELLESNARRGAEVYAPVDGILTVSGAQIGEYILPTRLLATISQESPTFEAVLWAPSRALTEVEAGKRVRIRYDPYPYQKFGFATGRVKDIAAIPMRREDLVALGITAKFDASEEFLYKVTVTLDQQFLQSGHKRLPLKFGMNLSADIILENRSLLSWICEPILRAAGRF